MHATQYQPHPRQRGFSLIELLVVIAIIVLLIGIGVAGMGAFYKQTEISTTRTYLQAMMGVDTELRIQIGNKILPHDSDYAGYSDNMTGRTSEHEEIERWVNAVKQFDVTKKMLAGLELKDTDGDGYDEVLDRWENPMTYRSELASGNEFPPHPRPFFVSAGPDGEFGDINGSAAEQSEAEDNLYSFELDD